MEKMPDLTAEPSPLQVGATKTNVLIAFRPVTLQREPLLFKKAVGLQPGVAASPDPDFLVHLFEGTGHQEQIRKATKEQFKNLENFLRGNHEPTTTTWTVLMKLLEIDDLTLRSLAHGKKEGHLLPVYVGFFQVLEAVYVSTFRGVTDGRVTCPCCKANMLHDSEVWWGKQPLPLPRDACAFVDRLLTALLGGVCLAEALSDLARGQPLRASELEKLVIDGPHPIGHWMVMVRSSRGLRHDWQLTVEPGGGPETNHRLSKWRSGVELLPMKKAQAMLAGVRDVTKLSHTLLAARTLGLAIDIVRAASTTPVRPSRAAAQETVGARLKQLYIYFLIGRKNLRTPPSGRK